MRQGTHSERRLIPVVGERMVKLLEFEMMLERGELKVVVGYVRVLNPCSP